MRWIHPTKKMISINLIGVGAVTANIRQKMNAVGGDRMGVDKLTRAAASTLLQEMKERIHQRGEDSTGYQIGTYSDSYMYTRRKKNRGSDRKVIGSLTGKMENSFIIDATAKGYALGFTNEEDFKKSQYLEQSQKKEIYKPQITEVEKVNDKVSEFIREELS